jgi:competence protein ComEC
LTWRDGGCSFLSHSKIRRIDYLVLTHPETDHMEGLRFIASHFGPKEFWYNGDQAATPAFRELMR